MQEKKHEKKGRRFKLAESGLPNALARSAVHVWEHQRSGVYSGILHRIYEFLIPPELQRGEETEPSVT